MDKEMEMEIEFIPEDDDEASDIEQAVQARSDALKRGEGGVEPIQSDKAMGEVRNQNDDAQ